MSQINRDEQAKNYRSKYLENNKVEWLIEHGKIRENVYFKGETGDRYTIYVATKRSKNVVDFHTIFNAYDHGTSVGNHIATIKDHVITMFGDSGRYWRSGVGESIKQLMRQGVCPRDHLKHWRIRFCRSAFFMRLFDSIATTTMPITTSSTSHF